MTIKVMSPQEMRASRVDALAEEIDAVVVGLIAKLRASDDFRAEVRAKALVIENVEARMRAEGWSCLVEKGGARDNGATWGLVVSAAPIRCPLCSGRGSWNDERSGDSGKCSRCGGLGTVR